MSAKEMFDYLATVSPDYNAALGVSPQEVITEVGEKNQAVHEFDDGSERTISFSDTIIYHVRLRWTLGITVSDAGTIVDFYNDAAKANGMARSFKWTHVDGHTYVVRFRSQLSREWFNIPTYSHHRVQEVVLKVLGKIAEA